MLLRAFIVTGVFLLNYDLVSSSSSSPPTGPPLNTGGGQKGQTVALTTGQAAVPTTGAVPSALAASTATSTALVQQTTKSIITTPKPHTSTPNPRADKTVCYEYVGCFDNFPPFDNAGLDLPYSPAVINTKFRLFTRTNSASSSFHMLDYRNSSTFTSFNFDRSKPVKFVVHGFSQDALASWVVRMKDEYLKLGDFNVITVDWKKGAEFPNYDQAVANTRVLATQMKMVIEQLMEGGLQMKDVHMAGHSLGAHASGYMGFLMKGRIGRISGMDPAEPSYENLTEVVRLDRTDAMFVDVIHTNGAPILLGGAGLMEQSGHIDFYVNGGQEQPGCKSAIGGAINSLLHGGDVAKAFACSHSRSHDLYVESMFAPCPFTAYPCTTFDEFQRGNCLTCGSQGCSQLGYYSNQYSARGKMFLNTAAKPPYCGYHYGIKIQTSSPKDTKGRLYVKMSGKWGDTDFLPVTEDETVKAGSDVQKVIVSPDEVGDLTAIVFKYVKHTGFWLGAGEDTLKVNRIKVTSGENGYSYLFCYGGQAVPHNTEIRVTSTTQKSCS